MLLGGMIMEIVQGMRGEGRKNWADNVMIGGERGRKKFMNSRGERGEDGLE